MIRKTLFDYRLSHLPEVCWDKKGQITGDKWIGGGGKGHLMNRQTHFEILFLHTQLGQTVCSKKCSHDID